MKTIKHISKQDDLRFLTNLVNTICKSKKDIDLSIILDREQAEYVNEMLEYNYTVTRKSNDFEHDFGELTGICLVTIIKEDNVFTIIIEDCSYKDSQGFVRYKNHEADLLMLLEGQRHIQYNEIIKFYDANKTILVSFENEENEMEDLLFS